MAQPFTIYGLRSTGSAEVRYVGFTRLAPKDRLHRHTVDSSYGTPGRPLRQWLLANPGKVEAFTICKARTEAEARAMEKGAIAAIARTGHPLFNSDHIPRELRFAA